MATIGTFTLADGAYSGAIKTLTLNVKPPKRESRKTSRSFSGMERTISFRRRVSWGLSKASAEGDASY